MSAVASVSHNLIPVCESFIADCETPVSAFLKLRELAPGQPCFLLESAEQGQRMGRYSFIGVAPREVLYFRDGDVVIDQHRPDPQIDVRGRVDGPLDGPTLLHRRASLFSAHWIR